MVGDGSCHAHLVKSPPSSQTLAVTSAFVMQEFFCPHVGGFTVHSLYGPKLAIEEPGQST
jgi:hypothetical protein